MKTAIVSASHRKNSKSRLAADWVANHLQKFDCQSEMFDLAQIDMPFWSEDFWRIDSEHTQFWSPYSARLQECDAIVLIAPEWAGMMPPKLTNFLLLCSRQEIAYKPALLIGVSAGQSGTYPIAQLRLSAAKNNQMIFLPDHLIIRQADGFLAPKAGTEAGSVQDPDSPLNRRLNYNLEILRELAVSCRELRKTIDVKRYPYGL